MLLDPFGYRVRAALEREQLAACARRATRINSKLMHVFREPWSYLAGQHLVAPGRTVLQSIVGVALTDEQARLLTILRALLGAEYSVRPIVAAPNEPCCTSSRGSQR